MSNPEVREAHHSANLGTVTVIVREVPVSIIMVLLGLVVLGLIGGAAAYRSLSERMTLVHGRVLLIDKRLQGTEDNE